MTAPLLPRVLRAMHAIAPLRLADRSWDNVGLLIEAPIMEAIHGNPRTATATTEAFKSVFITIDLTPSVLDECLAKGNVGVIIAYHPPLFRPFNRLNMDDVKQAIALRCIANGISVYSPHTALDNCKNGINDWLASGLGTGQTTFITAFPKYTSPEDEGLGTGRIITLDTPTPLQELVDRIKSHLNLKHVRVAKGSRLLTDPISTVAICAGSGSSVLKGVKADVYLTGEMSHHDVLAANADNASVVLCEHTNTERGYLTQVLQPRLEEFFKLEENSTDIEIIVSRVDRDPLETV